MFGVILNKSMKNLFLSALFTTLLSLYSVASVAEMQEYDFGNISISIPSNWYVHDKESAMQIAKRARAISGHYNQRQNRLLISNDRQNRPRAIVRLSTLPRDPELLSAIQEIDRASSREKYLFAEELAQEFRRSINIKKLYPVDVAYVGQTNTPAVLIRYDRAGANRASET